MMVLPGNRLAKRHYEHHLPPFCCIHYESLPGAMIEFQLVWYFSNLYATLVEYAWVFPLWSLVVSYHKEQNPGIWKGSLVPRPHFSRPLEKWSGQLPISFSFKCTGMLAHCFLLFNTWHHWRLHSTLSANDLLANCTSSGDCEITHILSCIINNERPIIKSPFFSITFCCNLLGPVTSNN